MPRSASIWALRGIVLAATATLSACMGGIAKGKVYDIAKDKVYDITREAAKAPVTIEPGTSVGPVWFGMKKDDVVRALGMPDSIFYGDTRFTLRDWPVFAHYVFGKAGLSVFFYLGKIQCISVLSERYEYPGGIRVGIPASRAEEVLGKMPVRSGLRGVSRYVVVYSGTVEYRIADYRGPDRFEPIVLKVNEATGMITELRIYSHNPPGGIGGFPVFDQEEPLGEQEAKALRAKHMLVHRDSGIPLDRYALMRVQWTLRPVDNTVLEEYPMMVEYWYGLKSAEKYELSGRDHFHLSNYTGNTSSPLTLSYSFP
jgi:hypothetical protein